MNPKKASILIIALATALLVAFGLHWYIQNREQSLRESISFNEGIISELKKQISKDSLLALNLKTSIDSIRAIKTDTLKIYENKYIKVNGVVNLNANRSVELLARNISQVDTIR